MQPILVSTIIVTLTLLELNVDTYVDGASLGHTDSGVTITNTPVTFPHDQSNSSYEGTDIVSSTSSPVKNHVNAIIHPTISCKNDSACLYIDGAECHRDGKICVCKNNYPATDGKKCFKVSSYEEFCRIDDQCQVKDKNTVCDRNLHVCTCNPNGYTPNSSSSGPKTKCIEAVSSNADMSAGSYVDPTLFVIMGVMVLMFIGLCVVMRIFAKAQFEESRSVFNTPNARVMNASVMKGNTTRKSSSGQDSNPGVAEVDIKSRDIAMDRRIKKKSSRACLTSTDNVELQSKTSSNQGRRKRSSAISVTGSTNNLGPDTSQSRKSVNRSMSPSHLDSRNIPPNGSTPRKLSDTGSDKQKRSSLPRSERKTSKERSCAGNIEEESELE